MNNGWIKLYRGLLCHWIFSDAKKFKWWVTILLRVNHEPHKVMIGNKLIIVGRGESVRSLRSWAMEFNTTPKTVKTFFSMLESDGMIKINSIGFSTHLTVCNWGDYQEPVNTKETESKQKVNTKETVSKHELPTNKKEKKGKNEKEYIYSPFFDSEIEKSGNDDNYIQFVKIIFGENKLGVECKNVLSLPHQMTYKQFQVVYNKKLEYRVSIADYIERMENYKDLKKSGMYVQKILLNWMNMDQKRLK